MKIVSAAIIFRKNCVLLTRRKKGQKQEGFWEFPGGKIEEDETPQSCLERELSEELGVATKAGKILAESIHEYEHGTIKLLGIETELIETNISISVHDRAEWVLLEELPHYKLSPADIPIAKTIIDLAKDV